MAGRLGLGASNTAIGVLLDGKLIASYDPTSPESALNWQHANVTFTGGGGTQTLSIVALPDGNNNFRGSDDEGGGDSLLVASLENLLAGLSESLSAAVVSELGRLTE
jgi:hypothetical protein